ncbi:uncharacterized protein BDR25DRAFT_315455 [Lindgomyces ingoldianus]|uniref:Uncharacterized protein n=1 Tax=Lindgomyces ingoldianus TaxID=673940 RepID=A0ACB6QTI6_9PLEO|nr:uncharacterized protein BDR25DRAFT_315455 [Lindgomyces ingoldianus]KAF2469476.1 hypothetical protein BDR25DRAFT_315455 [Lindgomyces ingoldianus]
MYGSATSPLKETLSGQLRQVFDGLFEAIVLYYGAEAALDLLRLGDKLSCEIKNWIAFPGTATVETSYILITHLIRNKCKERSIYEKGSWKRKRKKIRQAGVLKKQIWSAPKLHESQNVSQRWLEQAQNVDSSPGEFPSQRTTPPQLEINLISVAHAT